MRLVEKVDTFEDTIRNLKEGRKQDNNLLEEMKQKNEDLKTENFQLLIENKKLKNEMEDFTRKFSSMDKCYLERRQKTDEFINTLVGYQNSFQVINQVHLDLENSRILNATNFNFVLVFEPLKEQNRRLLEEKAKLLEENANLKLQANSREYHDDQRMEFLFRKI